MAFHELCRGLSLIFRILYTGLSVFVAPCSVITVMLMKFREILMRVLVGASGDGLMQEKRQTSCICCNMRLQTNRIERINTPLACLLCTTTVHLHVYRTLLLVLGASVTAAKLLDK